MRMATNFTNGDTNYTNFHQLNLGWTEIGARNTVANIKLRMSWISKIVFTIIYVFCFWVFFSFAVRATNIIGLLTLPCVFLVFGLCLWTLTLAVKQWKKSYFRAVLPLILSLLLLPIAVKTGHFIKDELFKWRFPRYEALVQKIESGAIPIQAEGQISPTNFDSSLAERVFASRETNGVLTVFFLYGGAGPPPYHELYLYISSGKIEPESALDKRYWGQEKIKDKWFLVEN
jgi:hypothetical protein